MEYIPREIEPLVDSVADEYAALLVTGPRQVGKSTLLHHVIEERGLALEQVTLDDLATRQLALNDPTMFFQLHEPPVLIDEVQYAPGLFIEMKKMIDAGCAPGSFWLTGSQQFRLMELAGESLAGRIAVLPLSSLSQREAQRRPGGPFTLDLPTLKERAKGATPRTSREVFAEMYRGAMPGVLSGKYTNLNVFYSSYIQTYIERDVRQLLGNVDALRFMDFMRAVAARCSQMVNMAAIAEDVGIRSEKAKVWLSVLERSGVVFYLHPFSNNQLKRTVKAPKLYFHDCGLVAHLARWLTPETLEAGAMSGAFMENFVVSEIRKSFLNAGLDTPLYYYRDRDGKEVDLVLECDGELHPIEIKKTASPNLGMARSFAMLDKSSVPRGQGAIICMAEALGALDANTLVIPAWMI
ncbi:MAG TPA: ATP-binding protein [Candidatus Rubneribacter avistercoris]|nr:ATP-binding protein [Candidatus Rubneribacter avistercoris]